MSKKQHPLYPLQFEPILKEKVWGGDQLASVLQKTDAPGMGESWELSAVPGDVSTVRHGPLAGTSLQNLITTYGAELLGEKVYQTFGNQFPLLFKFIDAAKDLSVQVHPDDALAKKRHDCFGKTEMWYVMHTQAEARLILGFNRAMNQETYEQALHAGRITEVLQNEPVSTGDTFFIAPGTVHAIGSGVLLAEIQQTSDITYRIYDWDRPDAQGNFRELHTEQALDAINFAASEARVSYREAFNTPVTLVSNAYFETRKWKLNAHQQMTHEARDSFTVWMCVAGSASLKTATVTLPMPMGTTLLVPACVSTYQIESNEATLLEVFIP
ncbi:type I phosphomannose isomerase catalytic subunit [Altibacter sp. HG106]|uniref:type I phosphomannose isomerase catalytic subunit n=1 Tax=Altibacter sp. HG106 TaxID=3023937 RepID=UPI0023504816|nr:type I phosphomannose isomerase catalytic subunit [Altibacter sp. HG106]MDC7996325.1 class I mannose-6-phosphate isomerase [Altibacter sp. HG106]